ncbi:hypothetical protein AB0B56_17760 [Streptosporangium canum]|uniref:hypothetical protein n=1 Tax=Streptosporangium canum TaxID=324952 RepID=UPI00341EB52E
MDVLRAEADLYGTMELAQQLQASDVGTGTLEALAETARRTAGDRVLRQRYRRETPPRSFTSDSSQHAERLHHVALNHWTGYRTDRIQKDR